ncbi:DUF1439 domain-containing protein [Haemophilus parahaemolyticus]|uniref:DUF1439 domain-containing protein n=2 Tax=Haemophilus parahaemolyticus TaxID=735 RepID=A0AAE6JPY2_HAEPH|nr:DUF1439 domain-containing protein [Haemophilus parahaemolyticus]EIJ73527.1 PF07273 family protein [Haemophilus parahaemolyticus HK385]OOR97839.1 hypothetical protein B0185_03330 [Haemophilus parahaemolyticus]QEN10222.1 DUF1439 domain-containing protein [Haemophilus parahaemolyticus]QRP13209.1 DUF1439 domain-containing protein [Haemophilus parahaemolyticus]STO65923.1 Uncharacterized lipoprotein yceB precursor [Haemophilus parahaemolyticus HK385]
MKFIYRIVAFFVVAIGVVAVASANLLSISEKEINDYLRTQLAEKIPLADSVGIPGLMQLDYQLHDLVTQIGQTNEKKVEIQGIVDGLLIARGKKHEAKIKINLDTIPYFDPEKGAVYLKDVRLLSWEVSPEKYQETVQFFLPMLFDGLTNLLNRSPVYTLDETKTKEMLVKKFGKAIIVEKGMLRLETSLF